eukprot:scaffold2235_cov201-Skeletonema_marinoi.AAC.2
MKEETFTFGRCSRRLRLSQLTLPVEIKTPTPSSSSPLSFDAVTAFYTFFTWLFVDMVFSKRHNKSCVRVPSCDVSLVVNSITYC